MTLGVKPGVVFGPLGARFRDFVNRYYARSSDLYVTSAYRAEDTDSHHSGLTWNGSPTCAVDFGALDYGLDIGKARMKALAIWLDTYFRDCFVEIIHTFTLPSTGIYVKNGMRTYAYAAADHWNHVHAAPSEATLVRMEGKAKILWPTLAPGGTSTPSTGGTVTEPIVAGPLYGWDASNFDHDRGMRTTHITAAQKEGITFFTHKLVELTANGTVYWHDQCLPKLRHARSVGIPFVGAYVVPRTGVSANTLADKAIALVKAGAPELLSYEGFFWQIDTEDWGYDDVSPTLGEAVAVALETKSGRKANTQPHYAPKWAYGNTVPNVSRPLWSSSYGTNPSVGFKQAYVLGGGASGVGWSLYSGRVPKIWQYGSNCIIGGQHQCDANAFKGSTKDFATMIGWLDYGAAPAQPVGEDDNMPTSEQLQNWPLAEGEQRVYTVAPVATGSLAWGPAWLSVLAAGGKWEVYAHDADGAGIVGSRPALIDNSAKALGNLQLPSGTRAITVTCTQASTETAVTTAVVEHGPRA